MKKKLKHTRIKNRNLINQSINHTYDKVQFKVTKKRRRRRRKNHVIIVTAVVVILIL